MFSGATAFKQILCSADWQKSKGLFAASESPHSRVLCCNAGSHLKVDIDPLSTGLGHTLSSLNWTTPDDQACDVCDLGQYSHTININRNCTPAARDEFVPARGMNTASPCSENPGPSSYTNPPNSTLCEICPTGWKMNRGTFNTTCQICVAGQFQEDSGQGNLFIL